MKIHFFEEYPNEENLAKLALVDWPATVVIAAPSLREFETLRAAYAPRYPHITFGWWPTVPGSYWVSAFSDPDALRRLFSEITEEKQQEELPVLLDLELPMKKSLYLQNLISFRSNKKRIIEFLKAAKHHNLKIYTAEYPASGRFVSMLWRWIGISPSFAFPHTKLPMVYSSMGKKSLGARTWRRVMRFEQLFALQHPGRMGFGLGTIATGVLGNEPVLAPNLLAQDIAWAKASGAEEVFVFRLGGFTEAHKDAIEALVG